MIGRRLYLQIYLAFIGVTVLCLLVAAITAFIVHEHRGELPPNLVASVRYFGHRLPADPPGLETELEGLAAALKLDLAVWDAQGALLAQAGRPLPAPDFAGPPETWLRGHRAFGLAVRLDDGRWIGGAEDRRHRRGRLDKTLLVLLVLAGAMAVGCYPIARRITRRLERLRRGVTAFGEGALDTRVPVEGRDEVAELAERFNATAERIESLVESQKRVLIGASHELRSPLARLRLAVALLAEGEGGPERIAEAERDIAELDALIDDLLLGARLEAGADARADEPVDLLAVVREEAARAGAQVRGEALTVQGDPRLLARLVRNLLDNAHRHGDGEVEAVLEAREGGARLTVLDRGPGVDETERERIFEPFHRAPGHREGEGGAGVGLSLVRQIAERHGGTVRCLPREGGGSMFVVDLSIG